MKANMIRLIILTGILTFPTYGLAADYSNYSLQELSSMRGTLRNADMEERNSFRDAWRSKIQTASAEERAAMRGNGQGGKGYGDGSGTGRGKRQGGGNGSGTCDGSGRNGGYGAGNGGGTSYAGGLGQGRGRGRGR